MPSAERVELGAGGLAAGFVLKISVVLDPGGDVGLGGPAGEVEFVGRSAECRVPSAERRRLGEGCDEGEDVLICSEKEGQKALVFAREGGEMGGLGGHICNITRPRGDARGIVGWTRKCQQKSCRIAK